MSQFLFSLNRGVSGVGFPSLSSAKITPIPAAALASGENDLYTVPTGKRATIAGVITNISGGAVNQTDQIKNGGVYYKMNALVSRANNSQTAYIPFNSLPILEAGESFAFLTSGTGLNFAGYVIVFDTTESLSSPKILTLANGANALYTCPAGSVAYPMNVAGSNALIRCFNDSGGARTYTLNVVASGGSPSTTNQINIPVSTADQVLLNNTIEAVGMNAGDFININTTAGTATQTAYIPNMVTLPV